tara:strand:- start:677 stop:1165 length:489 start_codon:yes stop_codon:yes gene_type:complete
MEQRCDTCFYEETPFEKGPCFHCQETSVGLSKWVAVDFLKNVPEDTSSMEGEKVMEQMLQQLDRIKGKEGVKYDSDKPKWTLLPFRALQEVVEVLTFGAKKYAADNWKHVPNARDRYIDAAYRHLADWNTTSRLDPETNKSHLAHAICCLLFLLWFEQKDRV